MEQVCRSIHINLQQLGAGHGSLAALFGQHLHSACQPLSAFGSSGGTPTALSHTYLNHVLLACFPQYSSEDGELDTGHKPPAFPTGEARWRIQCSNEATCLITYDVGTVGLRCFPLDVRLPRFRYLRWMLRSVTKAVWRRGPFEGGRCGTLAVVTVAADARLDMLFMVELVG